MTAEFLRFYLDGVEVANGNLQRLSLASAEGNDNSVVATEDGVLQFVSPGWYEVLLTVAWDPANVDGHRFSHTKIPGQQPLHSEAVSAEVLASISEGTQLLRGNTVFGHNGPSQLSLEVWQDSGRPVTVRQAELVVRLLARR